MGERQPFNPADDFDAMADEFRIQVCLIAQNAMDAAIYRDLPPVRQLECFLGGTLTGVIGCAFACITDEGRDALMDEIVQHILPFARQLAEDIIAEATPAGRSALQDQVKK
jgi:hypothetical protein